MSTSATFKKLAICALITGLFAASQIATAHTTIQVGTINEGTATYNNVVIGHGCAPLGSTITSNPVIAQSVVFPDGIDSTVTRSDGIAATSIGEFVTNWTTVGTTVGTGFGSKIKNTDVFTNEGLKLAAGSSDRVGFYGTDGALPGVGYLGLLPFRTGKITIDPNSCANSVTIKIAIADICKVTKLQGLVAGVANIWMPSGTGSMFDGAALDGYGSPASMKVVRAVTNPLPATCNGVGFDVTVTPSAAQINRDLPIKKANGVKYWPAI